MFQKVIGKTCKNSECEFKDKLKEDFNIMCDCGHALEDVTATDKAKITILSVVIVLLLGGGAYFGVMKLKSKAQEAASSEAVAIVAEGSKAINDMAGKAPAPAAPATESAATDAKGAIALVSEGLNLAKARKFQEAADKFNQATTKDSTNDQAWGNLGAAYVAMGKHAEALAPAKKAAEINPKNENWHLNLTEIYSVTGNKKDALVELELAFKNGFTDKSKLKSFNLKAIENEPKFKELVQEKKV
jgi:tetratricopeptide (TPR) repeat protein